MTLPGLAAALALEDGADEGAVLSAATNMRAELGRLRGEVEKHATLMAAERTAHAETLARAEAAEAQLSRFHAETLALKTDGLLARLRAKVGQKVGDDGKVIRGGTGMEQCVIQLAAMDLQAAEEFVEKQVPQLVPKGGQAQALKRDVHRPRVLLSEAEQHRVEQLRAQGITISEDAWSRAKQSDGEDEP